MFCLGTGAMLALAFGPWCAHDLRLFYFVRRIFVCGDIMLGDRAFGSYAELALPRRKGVDTVVRLHQARHTDFRRGRILGRMDHCVTWTKPGRCPKGLRRDDYRLLPETMLVRELQYSVHVKGYRTKSVTLATTLLDAEKSLGSRVRRAGRWSGSCSSRPHRRFLIVPDVLNHASENVAQRSFRY